jgi:hypothetical protein
MKFKVKDRVLFRRFDSRNNREDRGLGIIKEIGHIGTDYYIVQFDKPLHGYLNSDSFFDTHLALYKEGDEANCPECYEQMEKIWACKKRLLYQCNLCKRVKMI